MLRLLLASSLCFVASCTPGPEDHGALGVTEPPNQDKAYPYYEGIPDSNVPDAEPDTGGPAADTGGGAGGPQDTGVPLCPNAFGIMVPCAPG